MKKTIKLSKKAVAGAAMVFGLATGLNANAITVPNITDSSEVFAIGQAVDSAILISHDDKKGDHKCGEGKCGADKKKKDGKCGESKCGADKKKS